MTRSQNHRLPFAVVVLTFACIGGTSNIVAQTPKAATIAAPLIFEQNNGQAPARYHFLARRSGMESLYTADGVDVFVAQSRSTATRLQISWKGANRAATVSGEAPLPGRSNYLHGSDPALWLRNIPQFSRVRYQQVYPGIDLLFHGSGDKLENDFLVAPGADPSQIALQFDRGVQVSREGDLDVALGNSVLRLQKPIAHQESGTTREQVSAEFALADDGTVIFRLGAYDRTRPLIIDPVFGFSTYLAGTGTDLMTAVTTDATGNVYVTGSTTSVDFPVPHAEQPTCASCTDFSGDPDAYVSKLDPTGRTLLYSTYIGGSSVDSGYSIAVDKNSDILVSGQSRSPDFPQAGAVPSIICQTNDFCFFIASLKPDGSAFNYSRLIGGSAGFYTNYNYGVLAVDSAGNAYLSGVTDDAAFQLTPGTLGPTVPGYPYDSAFVLKVDPTGKLLYSTIIPGNAPEDGGTYTNNFPASGISVDSKGQVTLAGVAGLGLPTTPGVLQSTLPKNITPQAGYLLQINANATAFNFASYLSGTDSTGGFAVDAAGDFYITGNTSELNLPVSANAYQKTITPSADCTCDSGFVLELDSQAKTALAATYLTGTSPAGNGGTSFISIALDSKSNVLLGGWTSATNFPLQNPFVSILVPTESSADIVLAELNPSLSSLLFGSFLNPTDDVLGGSQFVALTFDSQDNAIVVGTTLASDFPTTANSFQPTLPPQKNPLSLIPHGFISKLELATAAPSVCLSTTSINFGAVLVNTSTSQSLNVTNCGNAPLQFTSITSSLPIVTVSQSCGAIAPAASCAVQLTFTPVTATTTSGTITLSDNAAIPVQTLGFSGTGGTPQIFFPPSFVVSDLLVGTRQEFLINFSNEGDGNWIVSNAMATGDFSVDNQCTAPLPPANSPTFGGVCFIGVIFAPSQAGLRAGTLTITDNAAGSPHVIPLSGNGLTTYPVPSITTILAVASDAHFPQLQVTGTNFFPASQIIVNGTARTTQYAGEAFLVATLTASDLAQAGELPVTVSNSLPGGGVSNAYDATIYTAIRDIGILHSVYDPNSGYLYSSVSATSANYPNQVIVFNPATASVVQAWSVGNGPNQLAVSSDGQFLYVGLDTDKKVAQVSLPSGTVNFAVGLGNDPDFHNPMVADAIRVLPGQPHSWAVTLCGVGFGPCGEGVAVFDDAVERPTLVFMNQVQPDALLFIGTNATALYGTTLQETPSTLYQFAINASGITQTAAVTNFTSASPGGGLLDTDGTSIYVSNGQVINPSTLAITSTISGGSYGDGIKVDVPNSRVYYAGASEAPPMLFGQASIQAFDLTSQALDGSILMNESFSTPEMFRWSSNGLAISAQNTLLLFRTSLTGTSAVPSQLAVYGWSPATVAVGHGDLTLTITGTQFAAGDTLTAGSTSLPLTVTSATQITTSIPASFFTTAGNVTIALTNSAKQVVSFALPVLTPGPAVASLSATSLTFPAQLVSTPSAAQSVTLSDTGTGALLVSAITITGDFTQTNNCASTIVRSGASCSISVTFTPTTSGTRTGTLTINDNDASKSQTVTLTGSASDIQIGAAAGSSTSATVPAGQSATYVLTVSAAAGFIGQLTFSCMNLPQNAAVTINPAGWTIAAGSQNVVVTISTSQQEAALRPRSPEIMFGTICWFGVLTLLPFALRGRAPRDNRKLKFAALMLAALLVALPLIGLMSCGGSGGGRPASATTPPGTYTVNFVATGNGVSRSIPLTLTVQ
jgi:HYDIN/CFA65/VesB family protein/beta-propeller repeat-containing protein